MPLDPPVQFYLEHRAQIEEWQALRKQVALATDDFFSSLAEPVRVLAENLGPEIKVWSELTTGERRIALYRPDWTNRQGKAPFVAIGFFWPKSPIFDGGWSGIFVNADDPMGKRISEPLRNATRQLALTQNDIHVPWWPTWRHERPANERFWEDDQSLDAFRQQLVEVVQARWESLNALVGQEVETARQQ